MVSNLVAKVRKKPELLRELLTERTEKQRQEYDLANFIQDKM